MKANYLETILIIERLHRIFLDVIKTELDRLNIADINNVQTLILHNIGDEHLTVGELTNRGYYLGSNVSYNVKKLVENGYLVQERSAYDKRSTKVFLSDKGLSLCKNVDDLYGRHLKALQKTELKDETFSSTNNILRSLEKFWGDYINSIYKL